MYTKIQLFMLMVIYISPVSAFETTGLGKITFTQGHVQPFCRTVGHVENNTGTQRSFRMADIEGSDDVSVNVLAALMGNRDTTISYNPGETTGCGTQPRILFITVY